MKELARVALEEERDGEAVEFLVARLGDFGLDGLELRVRPQPPGDAVAEGVAIARHRAAEDLHRGEWSHEGWW